ncbi:AI-2E family transporter, partial [Streptomyces sp. SID69]|nr:AI-2E family transporter [Streptomyces sp. SID69]
MSRVPGWLGKMGASLTEMSRRLDARQAEVADEDTAPASETARSEAARADAAPEAVADAVP